MENQSLEIAGSRVTLRFVVFTALVVALCLAARQKVVWAQDSDTTIHLPMAAKPTVSCAAPGAAYGTLAPSQRTDRPAAEHPDLNLAIRGWSSTQARLSLVQYGGPTDPLAPQLDALYAPRRLPRFSSAYRVNHWNWACDCRAGPISEWDVTLLGISTFQGELLHTPDSGYNIGGGYEALVLYATESRLTLKYTAEDNVVQGYTIHLEGVCVAPELLALYRQLDAAGRQRLPALRGGQSIGRAVGAEIRVAVRDNGAFLDPRSQKDWWKAYPIP